MSKNLDAELNRLGFDIVNSSQGNKEILRFIDKALGVLSNDGVYAYYVFCLSKDKKDDKKYSEIFIKKPMESLKPFLQSKYNEIDNEETFFQELSKDIYELLFFKESLEKALIYARYHAKAVNGDENE
ncbi:hypothetical protein [Thermoanaerobacter siderophilus]|uniref:CRISPR type III-B/RAMP module-associated protein Cmr5 n=1 Tax=Thermoanaerobacter siderophilus SR4 TaxID=880478 RepID=I9AG50_9THEO|nr:hypothetical protein [Thermoanaerobacter siderophilus]EIW00997.1 hypothetical protein ThesiDRAFT1_2139 [Thermoanaerobacter siderophilus SR4]